jgi:hypothetical protein
VSYLNQRVEGRTSTPDDGESIAELREAGVTDAEIRNAFTSAINRAAEK